MRIAGIDEAGRGPVVGPMVIACLAVEESELAALEALGVRDSKKISATKRVRLAVALRAMPGVIIREEVIDPPEIDAAVENRSITLNGLEMSRMAKLIDAVRPDEVCLDLVGASADRMQMGILRLLDFPVRVKTSAKAEDRWIVTAAASIIAKTRRDEIVQEIDQMYSGTYGPVGSGYPSDPKTVAFLAAAHAVPGIIRRSWASYRNIVPGPVAASAVLNAE